MPTGSTLDLIASTMVGKRILLTFLAIGILIECGVSIKVKRKEGKKKKEISQKRAGNLKGTNVRGERRGNQKIAFCDTPECAVASARLSESLDLTVNPCDDFFQFACGGWIAKHPLPEGVGSYGTFNEAIELLDKRLKVILENPANPGDPEPLFTIRTFYDTCMDTDTMEAMGLTPLISKLNAMGGWPLVLGDANWNATGFSVEAATAGVRSIDVGPLVTMGVDADVYNTSRKIIYVDTGELTLGQTILTNIGEYADIITAYQQFAIESAKLVRDELGTNVTDAEIEDEINAMIIFEVSLAKIMPTYRNETTVFDLTTLQGLQQATDAGKPGQFDWHTYFTYLFAPTSVVITDAEPMYVMDRKYMADLSVLLDSTSAKDIANYIGWWWVFEMGSETTSQMRNLHSQFVKNITGYDPSERWETCVSQANYDLGFAVSRAYVDEFFPGTAKVETEALIAAIRLAFDALIKNATWMLPADQLVAEEKLQAIEEFVAYPDWIMDDNELTLAYAGLNIVPNEQFDNLVRIGEYFQYWLLETLREEPTSTFLLPPTVVNAFYNPLANSITILAGILQPPFYAHNTLAALNYGGIGMVIGHELTHGFDDSGRQFDKDGNLFPWWSQETIDAFVEKSQCFVDQYNAFYPPELIDAGYNASINGVQTLGENIADNGGIREAFLAYQNYVSVNGEEPRLPGLDEFTPEMLFYLGFANVWCEIRDANSLLLQLALDPHSPGRYRVIGPLSNDENFSKVWKCQTGSPMNRGDEKCLLW